MVKTFTHTVDCELDWGGRTSGTEGIDHGIPLLLEAFKANNVKALFFISTESLEKRESYVQDILNEGHEIGNHGHFHTCFKEPWRQVQNVVIGETILKSYSNQTRFEFRAPKFHHIKYGHRYSYPYGHVSVLKHIRLGGEIPVDPIFYIHPFDIIGGSNPPNLFCGLWYSNPKRAYENFTNLLNLYPGVHRLVQIQ